MKNILITTTTFALFSNKSLRLLESEGYKVSYNDKQRKLTKKEITNLISDYDGIIAGTEKYDKDVLEKAKKLKVISRVGVGLDNIDLQVASEKNIKVSKTNTTPSMAVAELTLGLILDLLRKISYQNKIFKNGVWQKEMGCLLNGKTLGIIGLGNIGKTLVNITQGFDLKYLAYDLVEDEHFALEKAIEYCSMDDLLSRADIITIHLSMNKQNQDLINYEKLSKMKQNSILINTSRGDIINEDNLAKALKEEIISGAGLDVYKNEPYNGALSSFENVVTTPHIGAYAMETRNAMEYEAVQNLLNGLNHE
jgi:D-3-phosphoglycerate dehydrogenase